MALLGGGGYAGWAIWQKQHAAAPAEAPTWPPVDPPATNFASLPVEPPPAEQAGGAEAATESASASWVPPIDGNCPEGYPIKANDNSGIYHVPGGRFYDRTVPERCYARADEAEADGYRAAKS